MSSVSISFSATGASNPLTVAKSPFTISLSGFGTASVDLERKVDSTNWRVVETFTEDSEMNGYEPSSNAEYRFNCTEFTSGPIACHIETGDA